MNIITKFGLNLLQRARLDRLTIKTLNNKFFNSVMLKYCWQKRDYASFFEQYRDWKKKLDGNNISFKDKRILEIGAGSSVGLGYFFLADDFNFWLSTDLYNDLKTNINLIKKEGRLLEEIRKNYNKNIFNEARVEENKMVFGKRFGFERLQVADLKEELIEKFDIIISSAMLEHVERDSVKKALANLKSYLKNSGLMIHEIDLKDHINAANPFSFYKYSQKEWNSFASQTIFYSNRLRWADYLKIFNELNFGVEFLETRTKALPSNLKIDEAFSGYKKEELEIVQVFVILRKL